MKARILIADDERNIRRTFGMVLRAEGFLVEEAESGEQALDICRTHRIDLVILDVRLPGIDGLEALRRLRRLDQQVPVLMISGHGTIATAVEAAREGAFDFLEKPCSRDRVLLAVRNALRLRALDSEVRAHRERERDRLAMIGQSPALQAIREQIRLAAPTPARILIMGESGTGKELVARALHDQSSRSEGPFVKVNCAAIPEELIESELFGAVKGSYTGSVATREGKFQQADGGTLFLDEVGDMSPRAQSKVLRALQDGEIEQVGGVGTSTVDVRVIAATNRDLEAEVRTGSFREDLYFRLNVVPVLVPPLRERRGDIPLLAEHFLSRYCRENTLPARRFEPDALKLLADLAWPGNVRELHNAVERLAIMAAGEAIGADDLRLAGLLPAATTPAAGGARAASRPADSAPDDMLRPLRPSAIQQLGGLAEARRRFESLTIAACLAETQGNVSQAARLLGIDRTNLHKKIQAYGLQVQQQEGDPS